ncbi:hypothetical protein D9M73_171190 [compost metagenome]
MRRDPQAAHPGGDRPAGRPPHGADRGDGRRLRWPPSGLRPDERRARLARLAQACPRPSGRLDAQRAAPDDRALRPARRQRLGAVPAQGQHRHHRHLERAAVHPAQPAGLCLRRRQPRRAEAFRTHRQYRRGAGCRHCRALRSAGAGSDHRRRRGFPGIRQPALQSPGVHRQHPRRPRDHAPRRRQPGAGHPRTGRQVAGDHRPQRRPGGSRPPPGRRQGHQWRADLHFPGHPLRAVGAEGRIPP